MWHQIVDVFRQLYKKKLSPVGHNDNVIETSPSRIPAFVVVKVTLFEKRAHVSEPKVQE